LEDNPAARQDLLWVELSRHGERNASTILPLAVNPDENFVPGKMLTATGC